MSKDFNQVPTQETIESIQKPTTSDSDHIIHLSFLTAIVENDIKKVESCLADPQIDPAYRNNKAIRLAAHHGYTKIVELLLKDNRVNPGDVDNFALCQACEYGHTDIVKLLLNHPEVNPADYKNYPICKAAENGHHDIVDLLLKDGRADPTIENNQPLYSAIEKNHPNTVAILINDDRVDPSLDKNDAIKAASELGHTEIVRLLITHPTVDPSDESDLAIQLAAENGHLDVLNVLLEDFRVNPSSDNNLALQKASENGHAQIVIRLLQDYRVDPSDKNNAAIRLASKNGHAKTVAVLLGSNRVDSSVDNNYCIRTAVENGHSDTVEVLMYDKYVDVTVDDNYLIRTAAENDNTDIVRLLLQMKDVDPTDDSNAVLWHAIDHNNYGMVKILLEDDRIDPSCIDNWAIIWAAENGHTEIVQFLMEDDRVEPSQDNNEALNKAVESGHLLIIYELLKDERVKSILPKNFMPIEKAITNNHPNVLRILLAHYDYFGMPISEIIDLNTPDIINEVKEFKAQTFPYMEKKCQGKISPAQIEALKILIVNDGIHQREESEKRKIAEDQESAMDDSLVIHSNKVFEKIVKPHFENQFMSYCNSAANNDEAKKQAIIAIEKQIRGAILDEILKTSSNLELHQFVKINKTQLMEGKNEALMEKARDYFNSENDPYHAAWRGYDIFAPYEGYDNLLTEQSEEHELFSTTASNQGAITNTNASDIVRERVAYYFLLIQDKTQSTQDDIDNRMINFISELADLRRAHSEEYNNHDAPSCFPGYLGRITNLGYQHPLTQKTVTTKMAIIEMMRPIILDKFKIMLEKATSKEACLEILQALCLMSEKIGSHKRIYLNKEQFPDNLLNIRFAFTSSFDDNYHNLLNFINHELKARGQGELSEDDKHYVLQCIQDPSRDKMMGPLGLTFKKHIENKYLNGITNVKENTQNTNLIKEQIEKDQTKKESTEIKIFNPYADLHQRLLHQSVNNPAFFKEKLDKATEKSNMFNILTDYVLTLIPTFPLEKYSNALSILIRSMIDTVYANPKQLNSDVKSEDLCDKLFTINKALLVENIESKDNLEGFELVHDIFQSIYTQYATQNALKEKNNIMQ